MLWRIHVSSVPRRCVTDIVISVLLCICRSPSTLVIVSWVVYAVYECLRAQGPFPLPPVCAQVIKCLRVENKLGGVQNCNFAGNSGFTEKLAEDAKTNPFFFR